MSDEKKWYYVEYEVGTLEDNFLATSASEAHDMAVGELMDGAVDIKVQEMED